MRATLTVAFATILVAFASTSEAIECPQENGALVTILPNPEDCRTFYICNRGIAYLMQCTVGLEFNAIESVCDFPEHANCHAHHRPSTAAPTPAKSTAPEWEPSEAAWKSTTGPAWKPTGPAWKPTTGPAGKPTTGPAWKPTTGAAWEPTTEAAWEPTGTNN